MIETLLGSFLGGAFRLLPEFLKVWDRKGEREHELKLLQAEMEFAKIRETLNLRKAETEAVGYEVQAIGIAAEEQGQTARYAGKVIAAISALVRPGVTWAFVIVYFLVKLAVFLLAIDQYGDWKEVLVSLWTQDDMAMLMMILTFWFVGRVWERTR